MKHDERMAMVGGRFGWVVAVLVAASSASPGAAQTPGCDEISASNGDHIDAGRGQMCGFFQVCAVGSGEVMGSWFDSATLHSTSSGYWELGSCPVSTPASKFIFPVGGQAGRNWVITNYYDLDPAEGSKKDYTGAVDDQAVTYDNHTAVDIDIANFRHMDAGIPVYAMADGVVVDDPVENIREDRNTKWPYGCGANNNIDVPVNYVAIEHDNGYRATYAHLRYNSVPSAIVKNATVSEGDVIGYVGSSGCSSAPHLHLDVYDVASNDKVDPFLEGLWQSPKPYDVPATIMDAVIKRGYLEHREQVLDPLPNETQFYPGDELGLGWTSAGGIEGDELLLTVRRPDGTHALQWTLEPNTVARHEYGWGPPGLIIDSVPGTWQVDFEINGSLDRRWTFDVSAGTVASHHAAIKDVPEAEYQSLLNYATAVGISPTWIQGYEIDGDTYFAVVFERTRATPRMYPFDLNEGEFDAAHLLLTEDGYHPVHVESYRKNGEARYAAIYEKSRMGEHTRLQHGLSAQEYQSYKYGYEQNGFVPINVSELRVNGALEYTVLYARRNWGSVAHRHHLDIDSLGEFWNEQKALGKELVYLDAYYDIDKPRFSATFAGFTYAQSGALWEQTNSAMETALTSSTWENHLVRCLIGYQTNQGPRYGAAFAR